jgi:hypothetical protein
MIKSSFYANPAEIGDPITNADLRQQPLESESFVGPYGYALAGVDGFAYPASTTDGGLTWRVAGLWFGGPWADGAAFPNTIRTYSRDIAAAFYPGESIFYDTTDGGATWFNSALPGQVVHVSAHPQQRSSTSPITVTITVTITDQYGTNSRATYRSINSGRTWSLIR